MSDLDPRERFAREVEMDALGYQALYMLIVILVLLIGSLTLAWINNRWWPL